MPDPVVVAADVPTVVRALLARWPAPAGGWDVIPEGLAVRRVSNPRTPGARLPAVTIRDTRATGPVAEVRQCLVCGAPVGRVEDRGKEGGGSRVWPCGCSEGDAAGGVLCGEVVAGRGRLGDVVAWLVAWGSDDVVLGVDAVPVRLPWLVRWDAMAGGLVFVTP